MKKRNFLYKSHVLLTMVLGMGTILPITSFAESMSQQTPVAMKGATATANGVTEVTPANFLDYAKINGDATYDAAQGMVTLTEDKGGQAGSFTLKNLIDMNQNITLKGEVNLGTKSKPQGGADGIGIGFIDGPIGSLGETGGNMGIGGLDAFGFKLDTFPNGGIDPERYFATGHSFGAFIDSQYSKPATTYDGEDAPAQEIENPKDNQFKPITVVYDGTVKKITVTYGGKTWNRQYSVNEDAYRAFSVSGSTGGNYNLQQFKLESLQFTTAGQVNTKYVDEDTGESLYKNTDTGNDYDYSSGRVGDAYATNTKTFANYALDTKKLPNNGTGVYTEETQTVTYYYKKVTPPVIENGKVTTIFVDEETNKEIASPVEQSGKIDDAYATSGITVEGYALDIEKLPKNASGTYTKIDQIVTYYYKKVNTPVVDNGMVTTIFVDEGTNQEIASPVTQIGKITDPYATSGISIDGYALDIKRLPENASGKYTETEQTVTYYYKKVDAPVVDNGTVTTKFVDEATNQEIAASVTQTGKITDPYATNDISVAGYALDTEQLPENATGTFDKVTQTVTYYYKKVDAPVVDNGQVTTRFVDEATNQEIAPNMTQVGKVTDPYTTSGIGIEGYALDVEKLPENASGAYTKDDQVVTYYYNKVDTPVVENGTISVKFIDEATNQEIAPAISQTGRVSDPYTTSGINIENYALDIENLPANAAGTYSKEAQTITYYYKKVSVPVTDNGQVTINFVDEETGQEITASVTQLGKVADPYATNSIAIGGYALDVEKLPENATGNYTKEEQTVTYYYKKVAAPSVDNGTVKTKFIDEVTNQEIAPVVTQLGKVTDPYTTSGISIENYALDVEKLPTNASGEYIKGEQTVIYYYKKVTAPVVENGTVTTRFVDQATNKEIHASIDQTGKVTDPYTTSGISIDGYSVNTKTLPKNASGEYTKESQTVTYYYNKVDTSNPANINGSQFKMSSDPLVQSNMKPSNIHGTSNRQIPQSKILMPQVQTKSTLPQTGEKKPIGVNIFGGLLLLVTLFFFMKNKITQNE